MTHHFWLSAFVIAACSLPSSATLTGRVIDRSSAPVAGANVALLNAKTTATTQNDGTFSIASSAVIREKSSVPFADASVAIKGPTIFITVGKTSGPVHASLYSLNGAMIAASECRAGMPGIRFGENKGISLIRIENGGTVSTIKLPPFSSAVIRSRAPAGARASKTDVQTAVIDTLLITKAGFVGKRVSVQSDDAQLGDITICAVDSGMILIPAMDSSFQMGSATGPTNEQPVHAVGFAHDFYMDTVEVTQGSYNALLDKSPWVVPSGTAAYTDLNASTGDTKAADPAAADA